MADNTIKTGDPWTLCDSCGFQVRRSQTRKMWDGKIVCAETCWDEKFPKTGVKIPSVVRPNPEVRPQRSAEAGTTTLASDAAVEAKTLTVTSLAGMQYLGDLGIVLDNGHVHWSHIVSDVDDTTISIDDALPSAASSGNTIYVAGLSGETFIQKIGPEDV